MQLVEVDVVGVEATQRVLARRAHVVGLRAEVRVVDRHAELGRDDDLAASCAERYAEEDLGLGGAVDVGGVKEIDPRLDGAVDNSRRAGLIESSAEVVAADADL